MKETKLCSRCREILHKENFYTWINKRGYPSYSPECRECHKKSDKDRSSRGKTPNRKYYFYKYSASKRAIEFDLSLEDFMKFWEKPCVYCKSEIETIGLDRIDNQKGYTEKNIVPCCFDCNAIKGIIETRIRKGGVKKKDVMCIVKSVIQNIN